MQQQAELQRVTEEHNAKKEENHRLSGTLNAQKLIDSKKDLTRKYEKQQAPEAEKARIKEEKTAYNLLETARDNVITQRDSAITNYNRAYKGWVESDKDATEKMKERDLAQGMMITLVRFVIAVVRGFSPKKEWPAKDVEAIANQKPNKWFKDEFFKSVGEKLNNLVDMFDTSQKTIPAQAPAPERTRAPTRAMDDQEKD